MSRYQTNDNISYQLTSNYANIQETKKSLKCLYANVRSIVKPGKFDELRCIVQSFQDIVHIIILAETWIKSDKEAKTFQLPGYTHYYNYRSNVRGGGVSIFAHNNLKHSIVEELSLDENHYLWVHIHNYAIDIGAIYKPERTNVQKFFDTYSSQLEKRKRAIVFGDYNFNLLNNERSTNNYKEMLKECDYNILNKIDENSCTRATSKTKTILDHVSTNLKNTRFHLAIIESAMSDHKQIYLELTRYQPERAKKRVYEAINYDKLYNMMEKTKNINENCAYTILEEELLSCISKSKIIKKKTLNSPRKDWINKEIIDLINKRNITWHKFKNDPLDNNKKKAFIKERNAVSRAIQKAKNKYYHKAFNDCISKPSKMWYLINDLSKNKIKGCSAPSKLQTLTDTITDVKEICECFNDFFSSIGSNLASDIPVMYHSNNIFTSIPSEAGISSCELSKLAHATTDEVGKIIDNLNPNSGSGVDGVSTKAIKCLKNVIVDDLTKCINKCLDEGTFPKSLKIAKVTPVYKSGTKSDPGNYRPISVLPVISKIYEKILYDRLKKFLESKNFLYKKQYGFRPNSNTLAATVDLVTQIKTKIDQKQITLGVFVDLKKAFDTVSHDLLLKKLKNIGITETAHDIFKSYLSDRYQMVKIGEYQSSPKLITYGVPQGSILGPLLFLIYINSINEIGLKGDVTLYADDTNLMYYGHSIETVIADAQTDLNLLNMWFQYNLLTININKTNYMIFAAKNKKIGNHKPLQINNQTIKRVEAEKYLGLTLDNQLTWKPHIAKIKSKIMSLTGTLRSIVQCFPRRVRFTIYNSLVKPHIDYLIEIWGSAAKTNLKQVQIAQNKLMKVLFNFDFLTNTNKMYKDTKILNVSQAYVYHTCILIRKILNKDIHTKICFTEKQQTMKLRNANNLILRPPRTNYGKKCILYEGAQLYNKLPKGVKDTKTTAQFKKVLKLHLLNTAI